MSRRADAWPPLRLRGARDLEDGFTVIEIVVALTLIALVTLGSVPLLIAGAKAAAASRMHTQAKNLAQQRVESMRDLQYHVDRQNGPFVDMLDVYYTDLNTTATSRVRAGETMVGKWVASGGVAPAPTTGSFFQTKVAQLAADNRFSQEIDVQFLDASGNVVPSTRFANYNSQLEGKDQPPSLLVAVTVTTSWKDHGKPHNFTTYTRIADSRGLSAALTSQGSGEVLRVTSSGPSGNALTVDLATAEADGSQSTGSTASSDVRALYAVDALGSTYVGANGVATSPNTSVAPLTPVNNVSSGSNCGWVSTGKTTVSNMTAGTTGGLPQVPVNVDTATPPLNQALAQLWVAGSGNPCGSFSFSNQSTSYSSALQLNSLPLVRLSDDNSAGNIGASGSAWVNATTPTVSPHSVTSGANASTVRAVQLFPNASFVTDGRGLVDIKLTSSTIACSSTVTSGTGVSQTSTGSYTVTVDWWQASGTRGSQTFSWNSSSGTGSADPLAAINPASIVVYQNGATTLHLSDYISSWSSARSITEAPDSGIHQLSGIVSVATQPVRDGDAASSVGLQVGNLSCVADDER